MSSAPRSTTTGSLRKASADGGPLRVGIDTGGTFTDVVLELSLIHISEPTRPY